MKLTLFLLFFYLQTFSQIKKEDSIVITSNTKRLTFNECNETKDVGFSFRNNSHKEIEIKDFSYAIIKDNKKVLEKSNGFITLENNNYKNERFKVPSNTTINKTLQISIPWKVVDNKLYFYTLKKGEEYKLFLNKLNISIEVKILYDIEKCTNAMKIFIE